MTSAEPITTSARRVRQQIGARAVSPFRVVEHLSGCFGTPDRVRQVFADIDFRRIRQQVRAAGAPRAAVPTRQAQ